ncbi:MAG: hypothetical protein JNM59_06490 [Hyphomonadaceae bacterium]|nr:hypothetical protein [Hyphomonadaceae bacterium]
MPSRNVRALNPPSLAWPDEEDAASDSLEANHYYISDVRLARWDDVAAVIARENEVLPSLDVAEDAEAEWEKHSERIAAEADGVADDFFTSLDPGIASAALALGAAGCIPFWSCNGGAFGGDHSSASPVVKFFAKPAHVDLLAAAADKSGAVLEQDECGRCAVTADNVGIMQEFARAMREASGD